MRGGGGGQHVNKLESVLEVLKNAREKFDEIKCEENEEEKERLWRKVFGLEEEEGEVEEEEEREHQGIVESQDEGFKEDDQGSRREAKTGGLTREMLDRLFEDSEHDPEYVIALHGTFCST